MSDNTIDKDSSWEVMIDDATIDGPLAQFFDPDVAGNVTEERVDPGGDCLSADGGLMADGFVHKKENSFICLLI